MKCFSRIIAAVMIFTCMVSTAAYAEINVTLNGNRIDFDTQPEIVADRTFVPLRSISEAMGYSVDWNERDQKVTVSQNGNAVVLFIGSTSAYINSELKTLDAVPYVKNNRTYVPLRFISEAFGCHVNWRDAVSTAELWTDVSDNLLPQMSDDERYILNIFLSNFSEIQFGNFDAAAPNRDQLIYFGCFHNSRNHTTAAEYISDSEAEKYVYLEPDYIHACYKVSGDSVNNTLERYIGIKAEHGDATVPTKWGFNWYMGYSGGYYYFDSGEEGVAMYYYSTADSIRRRGDGNYIVSFHSYVTGDGDTKKLYSATPGTAPNYGRLIGTGTAVISPYNYNGTETYRMLVYSPLYTAY